MDLFKIIRELLDEKDRINEVIAHLEAMRDAPAGTRLTERNLPGRRGRKSMDPAEREEVSRRMKNYWEKRRKAKSA